MGSFFYITNLGFDLDYVSFKEWFEKSGTSRGMMVLQIKLLFNLLWCMSMNSPLGLAKYKQDQRMTFRMRIGVLDDVVIGFCYKL